MKDVSLISTGWETREEVVEDGDSRIERVKEEVDDEVGFIGSGDWISRRNKHIEVVDVELGGGFSWLVGPALTPVDSKVEWVVDSN